MVLRSVPPDHQSSFAAECNKHAHRQPALLFGTLSAASWTSASHVFYMLHRAMCSLVWCPSEAAAADATLVAEFEPTSSRSIFRASPQRAAGKGRAEGMLLLYLNCAAMCSSALDSRFLFVLQLQLLSRAAVTSSRAIRARLWSLPWH